MFLLFIHMYTSYKLPQNQKSVAGSVIQATGMVEFEYGLDQY